MMSTNINEAGCRLALGQHSRHLRDQQCALSSKLSESEAASREGPFADELYTYSCLNGEKSMSWTGWSWTEEERKRVANGIIGCGYAIIEGPFGRRVEKQWKIVLPRISGTFVKHLHYVDGGLFPLLPTST